MPLLTCKKCGRQVASAEIPEDPNWVCAACTKPATAPTEALLPAAPPGQPAAAGPSVEACPECGSAVRVRGPGPTKLACPSCRKPLEFRDGTLSAYDEFRDFLRKRTKAVASRSKTGLSGRAEPRPRPEPQPDESAEEAEHAPFALLVGLMLLPLIVAVGLTFWPNGFDRAKRLSTQVMKLIGP